MCKAVSKQCRPLQSVARASATLPLMSSGLREIQRDEVADCSPLVVLPALVRLQCLLPYIHLLGFSHWPRLSIARGDGRKLPLPSCGVEV